ncbi:Protein unc-13 like C [Dissostichus eleginoides]|uniref:Protein unc-13 like C n=1 Tax=Dissostichus eleginoides TaxID=100907 RepID=A0AAD9F730_DISEL|nr:Protein unc-13 like C [Dissostichus eleginoides]
MAETNIAQDTENFSSTPTSKRCRQSESVHNSPDKHCCTEVSEILISIDNKLSGLDSRIALVEVLHREFQQIRESLEFSQDQIITLIKENKSLQHSVTTLTTQVTSAAKENKEMKETVLDLQGRSMRDNLVFSGIPEQTQDDNPEQLIKDFMITQLKISPDTVKDITFHMRVHRIGQKNTSNKRPRPVVAKFEHFKQKQQRQGRQLKGTDYGLKLYSQSVNKTCNMGKKQ